MNEILRLLDRHGPELSRQVLDAMYADPFWTERFGDRGRRHADEDSDFHLRYLKRALANGDEGILVRYALWLRDVLVSRYMCSRHLGENFERLADAIVARQWGGGDAAARYLRSAQASLRYTEGPASLLQGRHDTIAETVERSYRRDHANGWTHDGVAEGVSLRGDIDNLLSYLADALDLGSDATFVHHAKWMAGHLERRQASRSDLDDLLRDALHAIREHGGPDEAISYLQAAREAACLTP